MGEEHSQVAEEMKRRDQDIELMELLLKHKLTKKRAEYKLLIMYYKACNVLSKAKLMMMGVDDSSVKASGIRKTPDDVKQASLLYELLEKRASNL